MRLATACGLRGATGALAPVSGLALDPENGTYFPAPSCASWSPYFFPCCHCLFKLGPGTATAVTAAAAAGEGVASGASDSLKTRLLGLSAFSSLCLGLSGLSEAPVKPVEEENDDDDDAAAGDTFAGTTTGFDGCIQLRDWHPRSKFFKLMRPAALRAK